MKYAVLADIHGNVTALNEVLFDCKKKGLDHFILLGDLFTKGTDPQGVYDRIKELMVSINVCGNADLWLLGICKNSREEQLAGFAASNMDEHAMDFCRSMKVWEALRWNGQQVVFTHDMYQSGVMEEIQRNVSGADVILSGHTHISIGMESKRKWRWNPGSVGMPYDGKQMASYGILDLEEQISFDIVRVKYDWRGEKMLASQKRIPFYEEYCYVLENGLKYQNNV